MADSSAGQTRNATGKSLVVLNPSLTLNQRVPGSSPGAPTKRYQSLAANEHQNGTFGWTFSAPNQNRHCSSTHAPPRTGHRRDLRQQKQNRPIAQPRKMRVQTAIGTCGGSRRTIVLQNGPRSALARQCRFGEEVTSSLMPRSAGRESNGRLRGRENETPEAPAHDGLLHASAAQVGSVRIRL